MDYPPDFVIAQERFRKRNQQKHFFYLWLTLLLGLIILIFLAEITKIGRLSIYMIPVVAIVGVITLIRGIRLYRDSPNRKLDDSLIQQEMTWLFGEAWEETTGTYEYAFAQDRINKRRSERWLFLLNVFFFIPIGGFLVMMGHIFTQYREPVGNCFYAGAAIWLFLLAHRALMAFGTKGMLARRERKAGESLQQEIERIQYRKHKHEEKPKRGGNLILSDDGEIVEIDDDELWSNPPKRKLDEKL